MSVEFRSGSPVTPTGESNLLPPWTLPQDVNSAKPAIDPGDSVAVIGIGSDLRGDDAVGLELVRQLAPNDRLLVVEGGVAPENHTGVIRHFDPDWIILVDAVDFGAPPGQAKWVDTDDLAGESFSSHKSTPAMLQTFLSREMDTEVALFGIQPATIEMGEDLSPDIEDNLDQLLEKLSAVIH